MSANTATLADSLPAAIRNKLLERAVLATPLAYFSFFANNNQREGKQDADFTGRIDMPVARLQEELAHALAKGHTNIQVYADMWVSKKTTGPCMTGRARNVVPDAKRFEPKPQVDTSAEAPAEEQVDETSVTP